MKYSKIGMLSNFHKPRRVQAKKKKKGRGELIKHRGFTDYRSERETYFNCLFLGWKVV